jgi:hypothetical protein
LLAQWKLACLTIRYNLMPIDIFESLQSIQAHWCLLADTRSSTMKKLAFVVSLTHLW